MGIAVDGENVGGQIVLEPSLRTRHLYLIGKTRTGKTTLIKNLALQDMEQGAGLCFVDPHGDAAEDLIGSIPKHRLQDVIYFDPASEYAPAFNILRLPYQPYKLAEDTVSVFKMFFDSSGVRLEHLLRYAILTLLLDTKPRTLKDLRTLLVSESFRAEVLVSVRDEAIREFWETEFPRMGKEAVLPITNRLSTFLLPGSPMLRLFSQPENDLDFSRILNEQKILIVNLAKGKLGESPSRLLGGLIVTGIQQAALARAELPPERRKDFHLYLDEFQNFVVQSFESILSEAAKYKLFLTLAHQTLNQVPSYLTSSIFGNVATLIAFQISADDAAILKREMHRSRITYRAAHESKYHSAEELTQFLQRAKEEHAQRFLEVEKKIAEIDARLEPTRLRAVYESHLKDSKKKGYSLPLFMDSFEAYSQECRRNTKEEERPLLHELEYHRAYMNLISEASHSSMPPAKYLSGIFQGYEFKESAFPDVDDFINQQPRHAFCRKERAENVTLFRTLPAPDPNPELKAAIIQEMERNYLKRAQQQTALLQDKKEQPVQVATPQAPEPAQPRKPKFIFTAPQPPPPTEEAPATIAVAADLRPMELEPGEPTGKIRRRRARRAKEKAAKANGAVDEEIDF